jgi:16S rRNA (cytosine1407-C5)-methyltransferase
MSKKRKPSSSPPPAPGPSPQEEALARYRPLLSGEEYARLLAELENPLYTTIRMNPLKVDPQQALRAYAARYGWQTKPVPFCETGWWVTEAQTAPSQAIEHRMGDYYIQDAASMLPVELFDWSGLDAPLVLDMAASPGGKTTHLVAKTGDHGLVIANDSSPSRITALRIVLETWGAVNTAVTRFPGEKWGSWYPETFNRVLLDAPCSMQGLHTIESHPMRAISEKEQSALATRQLALLKSAFRALKPGGQLVYSTCTLAPEEDEGVLDGLLAAFPGAVEIEDLASRLPAPAPALASAGEQAFHPAVQRAARLWPHTFGTSGFFAALVTKTAGLPPSPDETAPTRPFERTGLAALSSREAADLAGRLRAVYDFDLTAVLQEQDLSLWRHAPQPGRGFQSGTEIFAIPSAYLRRFESLPFQSLGMAVGEEGPEGFIPSHEWLARFRGRFLRGRWQLAHGLLTAWLRGEDIRFEDRQPESRAQYPRGTIVLVEDDQGRFVGRGRVTSERLKNLLPRRFVI